MLIIFCGLLGLGIVVALVPLTLKLCGRSARARDFHHTHKRPVPRLGGLALAGALVGIEGFVAVFLPGERVRVPGRSVVVWSSLAMFCLGFWDDLKPLGAKRKLLGQVLISLAVYYGGVGIETFKVPFTDQIVSLGHLGTLVTVLWLVGITNLINLIDGVDGLAGGIGLMLMSLLVYVGYQNDAFVFLSAGMTGALLGFLCFNFPPARIYLGDGGAYFIGFQIGLLAIVDSHKGSVIAALIAPLFVLALPIVDTCLAILRRGLRGLPLFRPDRRHIHHHLLSMGMSRRQVVVSLYGLTLVFLLMGFAVFWSRGHLLPVLFGLGVLILLLCAGRLSFSREWFAVGRTLGNSLAMRQEIQYALSLMNWLRHEGTRTGSLSDLYQDLVFAAHKLGFSSVKVTLAEGNRVWEQPSRCPFVRTSRQELPGLLCGQIELQAPVCQRAQACSPATRESLSRRGLACPHAAESRLFELMAELLAEGWAQAASQSRRAGMPVRFGSPALMARGKPSLPQAVIVAQRLGDARRGIPAGDDSVTA